jgi:hypothetical protein
VPDELLDLEVAVGDELAAEEFDLSYLEQGYDPVIDMLEIFCMKWRESWLPGEALTIDETMITWTGVTSGMLQYIIRKPSPLGILLKTLADAATGIIVAAELVEGVPEDHKKQWFA